MPDPRLRLRLDTLPADKAVEQFRADLKRLAKEGSLSIREIEEATEDLERAFKDAKTDSLRRELRGLQDETATVKKSFRKLGDDLNDAFSGLKNGNIEQVQRGFAGLATNPYVLATAGVVKGISAAVRRGTEAYEANEKAARKLEATSRLLGVPLAQMESDAERVARQYEVSASTAGEFTTALTKLGQRAGDTSQTSEAVGRLLDLASARGYDAAQALEAINQALMGQDEGTDKLFGKNPSAIYAEYAKQIGVAASKMDEQQKAQALLNAVMDDGLKVQGEYAEWLQTSEGASQRLSVATDRLLVPLGKLASKALTPLVSDLADVVSGLNDVHEEMGALAAVGFLGLVGSGNASGAATLAMHAKSMADQMERAEASYSLMFGGSGAGGFWGETAPFGPLAPDIPAPATPVETPEERTARLAREKKKKQAAEKAAKAEAEALKSARADLATAEAALDEDRRRRAGEAESAILATRLEGVEERLNAEREGSSKYVKLQAERTRLVGQVEATAHAEQQERAKLHADAIAEIVRRAQSDLEEDALDLGDMLNVDDTETIRKQLADGLLRSIDDVRESLRLLQEDYDAAGTDEARAEIAALIRSLEGLGDALEYSGDDAQVWADKIGSAADTASQVLGGLADVERAYSDRRIAIIENAAKREIGAINERLRVEGLSVQAREELEAEKTRIQVEADKERAKIDKAVSARQKLIAVGEILLNTAIGASRALKLGPKGIPLAITIGALGLAQVALVAATPTGGAAKSSSTGQTSPQAEPPSNFASSSGSTTPNLSPAAQSIYASLGTGQNPNVSLPPLGTSSGYVAGGSGTGATTVQVQQDDVVRELREVKERLGQLEPQVSVAIGDREVYDANQRQERRERRVRPV